MKLSFMPLNSMFSTQAWEEMVTVLIFSVICGSKLFQAHLYNVCKLWLTYVSVWGSCRYVGWAHAEVKFIWNILLCHNNYPLEIIVLTISLYLFVITNLGIILCFVYTLHNLRGGLKVSLSIEQKNTEIYKSHCNTQQKGIL